MRPALAFLLAFFLAFVSLAQTPTLQREVLVLTSPTAAGPFNTNTSNIDLQNLGPNPIFCTTNPPLRDGGLLLPDAGPLVAVNKGYRIAPDGGEWHITRSPPGGPKLTCVSATASQTTGGGTILTEW